MLVGGLEAPNRVDVSYSRFLSKAEERNPEKSNALLKISPNCYKRSRQCVGAYFFR